MMDELTFVVTLVAGGLWAVILIAVLRSGWLLVRDALRYRWLRKQHWTHGTLIVVRHESAFIGAEQHWLDGLDRQIDQGIEADVERERRLR